MKSYHITVKGEIDDPEGAFFDASKDYSHIRYYQHICDKKLSQQEWRQLGIQALQREFVGCKICDITVTIKQVSHKKNLTSALPLLVEN